MKRELRLTVWLGIVAAGLLLAACESAAVTPTAAVGQEVQLAGTLEEMGDTTWTIDGREVAITPDTVIRGAPEEGDSVEGVAVTQADGTLVLREVALLEEDASNNENANQNNNGNLNGNFNSNDNGSPNDLINTNDNENQNENLNGNDNGDPNENEDGNDNDDEDDNDDGENDND